MLEKQECSSALKRESHITIAAMNIAALPADTNISCTMIPTSIQTERPEILQHFEEEPTRPNVSSQSERVEYANGPSSIQAQSKPSKVGILSTSGFSPDLDSDEPPILMKKTPNKGPLLFDAQRGMPYYQTIPEAKHNSLEHDVEHSHQLKGYRP